MTSFCLDRLAQEEVWHDQWSDPIGHAAGFAYSQGNNLVAHIHHASAVCLIVVQCWPWTSLWLLACVSRSTRGSRFNDSSTGEFASVEFWRGAARAVLFALRSLKRHEVYGYNARCYVNLFQLFTPPPLSLSLYIFSICQSHG